MVSRSLFLGLAAGLTWVLPGPSSAQSPTYRISPDVPDADLPVHGPARGARGGTIVIPRSGREQVHTHYRIFVPNRAPSAKDASPSVNGAASPAFQNPPYPPFAGYYNETPASLACIYGLVARTAGCDPNVVTTIAPNPSPKAIAVVALGHDSSALADLQAYSTQFGLPAPNLTTVYVNNTQPANDASYAVETSLDLDMIHAMSPNAHLYLVEGPATSYASLINTIKLAITTVQNAGGGVVSISYGVTEFASEVNYESTFTGATNVVVFASAGDDPSVSHPASSPNVVAVGGTGTAREMQITSSRGPTAVPVIGQFKEEVAWDQGGGGYSAYFSRPTYQNAIAARLYNQNKRATPDLSAVADPATGVWVYCSTGCGYSGNDVWFILGGTSVASPVVASMTANVGPLYPTTAQQLQYIYSQIGKSTFFDVGRGVCGPNAGFTVTTGSASNPGNQYDLCTGVGSPRYQPGVTTQPSVQQATR